MYHSGNMMCQVPPAKRKWTTALKYKLFRKTIKKSSIEFRSIFLLINGVSRDSDFVLWHFLNVKEQVLFIWNRSKQQLFLFDAPVHFLRACHKCCLCNSYIWTAFYTYWELETIRVVYTVYLYMWSVGMWIFVLISSPILLFIILSSCWSVIELVNIIKV